MRVAEFFAGIGLVRLAMERRGHEVVWANDIDPVKQRLYAQNFDARHFVLCDIRDVTGGQIPDVDVATASFPCTDISLAGLRRGLAGVQSGMLWEFTRILNEMGAGRPRAVLLENVPSFATSNAGKDLRQAVEILNDLGYWCDLFILDARHFVPQSRPRLFIVGWPEPLGLAAGLRPSVTRPGWITRFMRRNHDLKLNAIPLQLPSSRPIDFRDCVERLGCADSRWWDVERTTRFEEGLEPLHTARLFTLCQADETRWATAYRRTRSGRAVWEIRSDGISGCLRAVRGGSSKQALIEAGHGAFRVRWMTRREYACLQGCPDYQSDGISEAQALFGFGDAVCVPAVEWIVEHYLQPLFETELGEWRRARQEVLIDVEAAYTPG